MTSSFIFNSLSFLQKEAHYDYGKYENLGKIFLNDIILNIINNYNIYYFTYNNNTIKILIIKNINYCESNKFSYKIG